MKASKILLCIAGSAICISIILIWHKFKDCTDGVSKCVHAALNKDEEHSDCELSEHGVCRWDLPINQKLQDRRKHSAVRLEISVRKRDLTNPVFLTVFVNNPDANAETANTDAMGFIGNITLLAGNGNGNGNYIQSFDITSKVPMNHGQIDIAITRSTINGNAKETLLIKKPKLLFEK